VPTATVEFEINPSATCTSGTFSGKLADLFSFTCFRRINYKYVRRLKIVQVFKFDLFSVNNDCIVFRMSENMNDRKRIAYHYMIEQRKSNIRL